MKKTIAVCLALISILSLFSGCSRNKKEKENPIITYLPGVTGQMYDADFWIEKIKDPDRVLLDDEQIELFNDQIAENSGGDVVDLVSFPSSVTAAQLKRWLGEAELPEDDLYAADGSLYGETFYDELVASVNAESITESVKVSYALTLDNIPLRAFPTAGAAYTDPDRREEDLFQQGMLLVGEAVVMLHMNQEQNWCYVHSDNQRGWVRLDELVFMEKGAWVSYLENTTFLVVTAPSVTLEANPYNLDLSGLTLYMGTRLPLFDDDNVGAEIDGRGSAGCYVVKYPVRNSFGSLEYEPVLIPISDKVSVGYQDYTPGNIIRTAMSLVGARSCVNRLGGGRDNPAFVVDLFRTFGITMPATTQLQKEIAAQEIDMASQSSQERSNTLKEATPGALIFSDTGAFIYLGMEDKVPYVISHIGEYYVDSRACVANACVLTGLDIVLKGGTSYLDSLVSLKTLAVVSEEEEDVKSTASEKQDKKS